MDKEELEKEARINLKRRFGEFFPQLTISYVMGAEPRERRIEELEMTVGTLRTFSNEQATCIERLKKENEMFKKANEIIAQQRDDRDADISILENRIEELEQQIEKMKEELHHRLVSPSHDDSDCLDKIIGLDRLWQFGKEF